MSMVRSRRIPLAIAAWLLVVYATPLLADGPGELKFDEESFEVLEEAGLAIITVERSRGEDGLVSVDYATADGSATAGSDYTAVSGTLTWGAGDGTDRTFEIPILDDAEAEGLETVQLTLSNPTGGATFRVGGESSVLRILDGEAGGNPGDDNPGDDNPGDDNPGDDGAGLLKFDQRNFLATEGSGMAVISVERSKGEGGLVSVDYATADGSATAGSDYTAVSGTLTWASGDGSRKTFQVPITNDGRREPAEHVELTLSNPTGGAGLDAARSSARLTILDNDQGDDVPPGDDERPGTLKFDERGFQVIEGQLSAVISVERSKGEAGTVSVEYATVAETAAEGEDYTGVSGVLTWAGGDGAPKTFTVPILDDEAVEGNETLGLVLSAPTGGAGLDPARATAKLVILDDDGSTAACTDDDETLCLAEDRFRVEVVWRTRDGSSGVGRMIPETDDSGLVWFFEPSNVEMLVKVLDACVPPFDSYWVFFSATTNVDFTVTVTDTATGVTKEYMNPGGQAAQPVQDTFTFETCP